MNITEGRTKLFLDHLQSEHDAEYATVYGEPGYPDPEKGILFANWNNVRQRVQDYLEAAGYTLEWSDEWTQVNDKAYRTSPDSYIWRPTAVLPPEACEYLTPDGGAEEAIEVYASEHPGFCYAVPYWVTDEDLTNAGFVCESMNNESGLHQGQTDNPVKIGNELLKSKARRVLARVDDSGQFDCRFSIWYEPVAST